MPNECLLGIYGIFIVLEGCSQSCPQLKNKLPEMKWNFLEFVAEQASYNHFACFQT